MQTYTPSTTVIVPTYCPFCDRYISLKGQQVRDDFGAVVKLDGWQIDAHYQAQHPAEHRKLRDAAYSHHRRKAQEAEE